MSGLRDIAKRLRRCARCGHQWLRRAGLPEPRRCPNDRCRTMRWRGAGKEAPHA